MGGKKGTTKKARTPSLRQRLKDEGVLQGKSKRRAALDAGYAVSTANSNIYKEQEKARTQERIQERVREAQIDTNEIIGTLVSHMRGDFADLLPEDEFLRAARERGVSHLVKELEIIEHVVSTGEDEPEIIERRRKFKIHDPQSAAKQLCSVFGLDKEKARNPEDTLTRVRTVFERVLRTAGEDYKGVPAEEIPRRVFEDVLETLKDDIPQIREQVQYNDVVKELGNIG